ncbi:MAG TPA: hypothetical protein VNH46_07160 [Gemmatimonadales bacterium]|nr:hypothetical protein [Gemmatimonadales bacterium]
MLRCPRLWILCVLTLLASDALAQDSPLTPLSRDATDPTLPVDRGRGVVGFSLKPQPAGTVDSLAVRRLPTPGAPIIAYFLQQTLPESSPYVLTGLPGLTPNLVEFGYEILGLPLDSLTPDSGWARVIYAFDAGRRPQWGWIALDTAAARVVLWTGFLPTQDLYLADSVPWTFVDQPGGTPLPFAEPADPNDYVLHPVAARGDWLQVRVVVPGDTCQDPQPGARTLVGWVRYLDASGRPRVWFYPRGC